MRGAVRGAEWVCGTRKNLISDPETCAKRRGVNDVKDEKER